MAEPVNSEFDAAVMVGYLPLAMAAWKRYAPRQRLPSQLWLIRVEAGLKEEARAVTRQYATGAISRAVWEARMHEIIAITYVLGVAAALGVWELTIADMQIASEQGREQYGYWLGFRQQLDTGEQKNNGTLIARAGLYALAGWSIMWAINTTRARLSGYTEEIRVLGAADHCPDCLDYAARGWQPLGTLPEPGQDSVCGNNCHCHKEYR